MAVTVSEIPGPGGTDAGGALTVSQEESAVADEIDNCPPPEFESGSDAVCDCGFDVRAANEIRLVPSVSSAGGDVTESDTEIVCEVPVHDPELQSRLFEVLDLVFADETNAWALGSDRRWRRVPNRHGVSSQERLKELARERARRRLDTDIRVGEGDEPKLPA